MPRWQFSVKNISRKAHNQYTVMQSHVGCRPGSLKLQQLSCSFTLTDSDALIHSYCCSPVWDYFRLWQEKADRKDCIIHKTQFCLKLRYKPSELSFLINLQLTMLRDRILLWIHNSIPYNRQYVFFLIRPKNCLSV